MDATWLRTILVESFNPSELQDLCGELGLDYEELGGDNKESKARELVLTCETRGRLGELEEKARNLRPHLFQNRAGEDPPTHTPASGSAKAMPLASPSSSPSNTDTEGGAYIGGDVDVSGGNLAGRDVYNYYGTVCQDGSTLQRPEPSSPHAFTSNSNILPAKSRMPPARNAFFVGRDEELTALHDLLQAGHTTVIAATGIGGIGKTQLACEYVYRHSHAYPGGVYWLSFAEAAFILAEIAACGAAMFPEQQAALATLPLDDQVQVVLRAWHESATRLLVFDNCEARDLLLQYRPKHGGCQVLVTSRWVNWDRGSGIRMQKVSVLPRERSIELLAQFRPDLQDDPLLVEIAGELGDLLLALHLAGSYLGCYQDDPPGDPAYYLKQWRAKSLLDHPLLKGLAARSTPTEHGVSVARTFALSVERLQGDDRVDKLARALLARAACFAPGEPIPRHLLRLTIELPADEVSDVQFSEGVRRLTTLGLLETEAEEGLRLHRLIAMFVRDAALDETAQAAVEEAVASEAARLNNAGIPGFLFAWQAHLVHITNSAQTRGDERAAQLCNSLGSLLRAMGDSAGARSYYEQALAIYEEVLGPRHPATALSLNNLGMHLQAMGNSAGARPYYERALAICEATPRQAQLPDRWRSRWRVQRISRRRMGGVVQMLSELDLQCFNPRVQQHDGRFQCRDVGLYLWRHLGAYLVG